MFNALITYARFVVSAGLALFGNRWVLQALGQEDFGLFSVIGSTTTLLAFLGAILATSTIRHLSIHVGSGASLEARRFFTAAVHVHTALAFLFATMGWFAGDFFIHHYLVASPERISASLVVFRAALIAGSVSMAAVPFVAMFTAKQAFGETGLWGIAQAGTSFVVAWRLDGFAGDRLVVYGVAIAGIAVLVQLAQVVRATARFQECRLAPPDKGGRDRRAEILGFAGWNLFGGLGSVLRDQGIAILINLRFGPSENAAYGIANQVSMQSNQLSASVISAFAPEVSAAEGRGERNRALLLAARVNKFSAMFALLFAVPLIADADYVLRLWLHAPPERAAGLCAMILVAFVLERLSAGFGLAINAFGRIAAYQVTLGSVLIATLPVAWALFSAFGSSLGAGVAIIATIGAVSFGRALWAWVLLSAPVSGWLKKTVAPCAAGALAASGAVLLPRFVLEPGLPRLVVGVGLSAAVLASLAWSWLLDADERSFLVGLLGHRLRHVTNPPRGSAS